MKKVLCISFSLLFILFSAFSVYAENETYFISDLNISIDIPSDYNIFTRDIEEDSFTLKKFRYTKDELLETLEEKNIYFEAFKHYPNESIVITSQKIKVSDICIFEDDELESMIDDSIQAHEAKGAKVSDCKVYVNKKTTYLVTTIFDPIHGNAINYYTINNYEAINITCWTYENDLDNTKKEFFASIIDSITYHAYSEDNGKIALTPHQTPTEDIITEPIEVMEPIQKENITPLNIVIIITLVFFALFLTGSGVAAIIVVNKVKRNRKSTDCNTTMPIVAKNKFCIYCSTKLTENDSFCHVCGKSQNINSQ